jgi:hypothetical protein
VALKFNLPLCSQRLRARPSSLNSSIPSWEARAIALVVSLQPTKKRIGLNRANPREEVPEYNMVIVAGAFTREGP